MGQEEKKRGPPYKSLWISWLRGQSGGCRSYLAGPISFTSTSLEANAGGVWGWGQVWSLGEVWGSGEVRLLPAAQPGPCWPTPGSEGRPRILQVHRSEEIVCGRESEQLAPSHQDRTGLWCPPAPQPLTTHLSAFSENTDTRVDKTKPEPRELWRQGHGQKAAGFEPRLPQGCELTPLLLAQLSASRAPVSGSPSQG